MTESSSSHLELLVDHSVLLGEPVDAIIGFSHPPDGSTDGVGLELSSHATYSELLVMLLYLWPSSFSPVDSSTSATLIWTLA